jgi:hypothetical protein
LQCQVKMWLLQGLGVGLELGYQFGYQVTNFHHSGW